MLKCHRSYPFPKIQPRNKLYFKRLKSNLMLVFQHRQWPQSRETGKTISLKNGEKIHREM